MKKILFVDTETTGLPRDWKAPISDLDNWPRLVQIAWQQFDTTGQLLSSETHTIRPEGFSIPPDASKVHGITTRRALDEGHDLRDVLQRFCRLADESAWLVGHNLSFDRSVVGAELARAGFTSGFLGLKTVCTMTASTDYCRIPGKYGYKWPTLSELYDRLLGLPFGQAHDAGADLQATVECFWKLIALRVIVLDGVAAPAFPILTIEESPALYSANPLVGAAPAIPAL